MTKSKPKAAEPPKTTSIARTPERTMVNGQVVSSSLKGKDGVWENNITMGPDEERAYDTGTKQFADLLEQVSPAIAVNDEQRAAFADKLYKPQAENLKSEYNDILGNSVGAANSSGTLDSIGFQDYRAKKLDNNLMKGLSDLKNQTDLQSYDLGNLQLAPIQNALSIFDTSISAPTSRGLSLLDPSYQGSQFGANLSAQKWQAENQRFQQMNQPKPRGFFGSLFG